MKTSPVTGPAQLPRSLDPLPGESLPGYLLRLACRLDLPPARVAELCGLSHRGRIPADHLLAIPSSAATVFAAATRLSAAEITDLGLRRFAGTYPALGTSRAGSARASAVYGSNWALSLSSRYCPACLTGDTSPIQQAFGGPWKLRWHLPVTFACPAHHQLLESTCPGCGNLLNATQHGRASLIRRATSGGLHPLQCRNTMAGDGPGRRRPPCGTRLDLAPGAASTRLPGEDLSRLLALQKRLDQRISPAQPDCQTDISYFPDLVAASQLIKLSWPAGAALAPTDAVAALIDSHAAPASAALETRLTATRTSTRIPGPWAAPDDPAQCGALLLAAEALLRGRGHDPAALREQVQPLARAAFERAPVTLRVLLRSSFSPVLDRALARQIHGFRAAGGPETTRLPVPARDCRFSAEEVPPYLPQAWYDTYFTGFTGRIPRTSTWTARHLRRITPLKLAEMTSGGPWTRCAEALGVPVTIADTSLSVLRRQLAGTGLWAEFETIAEQIARTLDSTPKRINYARRRQALASWQMPGADWTALSAGIHKRGPIMGRKDPAVGTVLVWAQVNQAEHLRCPLLATMRRAGQDTTPLTNEIAQFLTPVNQRGSRLELRHRFDRYAARLAARCDTGADPAIPLAGIEGGHAR